jgi:hypothetical protein
MNDLNTINRLNAEAIARDIPRQRAKGKYVVAEFNGLNFVGYSTHESPFEANARALEIDLEVGKRSQVYQPTNSESSL